MANSFPNCLFAIMQTYPENKVSSRISESKWSRMQMSKIMVKKYIYFENSFGYSHQWQRHWQC